MSITTRRSSTISDGSKPADSMLMDAIGSVEIQSARESTPRKRSLRSQSAQNTTTTSLTKWKSPRRCTTDSPNSSSKGSGDKSEKTSKSPVKKRLLDCLYDKPTWNPIDGEQLSTVKKALHVSTVPSALMCRENEHTNILEFCKQCVENDRAGSLYVCGCPGTGKSLSIGKVKEALIDWAKMAGFQPPEVLAINCTSLTNTSEIFNKILGNIQPWKKPTSPLRHLQNLYSHKQSSSSTKMMLIIADELDYLVTKDRAVLHDLFMLTTFTFSRCILIGIANAIDLADRFLPKLHALNCKPMVVTFRAYSKDQIIMILQQRLKAIPYAVFQPHALELCARKVAAASGDMRNALCICRSAIEMLEGELKDSTFDPNFSLPERGLSELKSAASENTMVRIDHMAVALSKAYRSPVVDTIQSLPQHQQIMLCSAVKLFRIGKKDTTLGEMNKAYLDICNATLIPPVGIMELSSMCRVLGDQGLLKLGQSRDNRLRRLTLNVDVADINFALQGIRFFRNCLQ